MPATSDVGTNLRNLSPSKWPNRKQRIAIALSEARKKGAHIPPPPKHAGKSGLPGLPKFPKLPKSRFLEMQ